MVTPFSIHTLAMAYWYIPPEDEYSVAGYVESKSRIAGLLKFAVKFADRTGKQHTQGARN